MPRLFPADKREGEEFIVLMIPPGHKLMSFDILLGCFSSRLHVRCERLPLRCVHQ